MHSVVPTRLRRALLFAAAGGLAIAAPVRGSAQPATRATAASAAIRGSGSHPSIFLTAAEAKAVGAAKVPAVRDALTRARIVMDSAFAAPIDVPPPGEAGGYAHERHKRNYREMQTAGMLWQITGEIRYARFVRDMLERYAVLYPTLGAHPLARGQAPGKLFHQSLNEANWLVATAIAYDCVYDWLSAAERARFESTVFRPMADWLSVSQAKEFDRIHNHGTWAVASVGLIGYVMRDTSYVNRALYGTTRNRTGGFLRQMDLLFSPDGYYMEGPYYTRYALMPFFQFAEAIERQQPSLRIYAYRDSILKKALRSMIQTAFPNGAFPPINDASRAMSIEAPEVVLALDIAYARYGADRDLLGAAAMQRDVLLNHAGLAVARDLAARSAPPEMNFGSVEFTDGPAGEGGGLGILRSGVGRSATMLLMKYGVHGEGHGHFDKLHFVLFDGGREVVPDYGFARWINIEPKFGGRYLPENNSYAMSTVAHNTVVVDERAQSGGKHETADEVTGARHFFDARDPSVQVMSARDTVSYDGVGQQRTMFLVRDARLPYPVVIDVFSAASAVLHEYDYPLHFRGQLIASSVPYRAATTQQDALGTTGGYQHLWTQASGTTDGLVKLTWLDGGRYYTALTASAVGSEVIFARTGAGDPNFNLMSEPLMLVRRRAAAVQFASVIEPHGFFSELQEKSVDATGRLTSVRIVGTDASAAGGTVVEITGERGLAWVVMIAHGPASTTARHRVVADGRTFEWTGNYSVTGVQRAL